ncbi:hypothetical protein AB0E16_29310, partial [Streptomyces sp. NPDC047970]|uniref:hypothetical protein n=1 Tax=Streptomyces sp. NPDC047970 TaxID=3155481 RepID=UPI0034319568
MSEHRRKPPQPQGGGRAAARRAAQQPSGRRAAPGWCGKEGAVPRTDTTGVDPHAQDPDRRR